jgi:hypothetical protein
MNDEKYISNHLFYKILTLDPFSFVVVHFVVVVEDVFVNHLRDYLSLLQVQTNEDQHHSWNSQATIVQDVSVVVLWVQLSIKYSKH